MKNGNQRLYFCYLSNTCAGRGKVLQKPAFVLLLSVQYVCRSGKGSTETSVCTFVICPIRVQVGERFYRNQRLYFCYLSNTCAGRGKVLQKPASALLLSVQYVCRSGKGSTETSVCTFVICPIRVQVGERFYRNQRLYFCYLSNTCAGRGKVLQKPASVYFL